MKNKIITIKNLKTPIKMGNKKYEFSVKLNISFQELKNRARYIENRHITVTFNEVFFETRQGRLIVTPKCDPYIDSLYIWMQPNTNVLRYLLGNHLTKKSVFKIVDEFNNLFTTCCNQVRLCKTCIGKARQIITY